tara:strand:+ start:40 stop:549 length:510 start_codon:yes stop_codon:yes gene_type:complete
MILPPVSSEYDASSQAVINEGLIEADDQNFKLDQDNFLKTGSICLQSVVGDWYRMGLAVGVGTVGTINDGGDHSSGIYISVSLTGGSGSGAKADLEISSDHVQYVSITSAGDGYAVSDVLSIPNSVIGGSSAATCVVATLDPYLNVTKLTGTQLDADGRPSIASTNPYT